MSQFSHNMKWGGVRSILIKLLGCFLLVTAALKAHGLYADPYGQDNFLALPWLQVLTIEIEVILGLWLLSGLLPRVAWGTALVFFIILAALSFTLAYQGQASCGCFGKVEVNPWYTFALDVGIVIALVAFSPLSLPGRGAGGEGLNSSAAPMSALLQVSIFTTILLSLIALGFTLITGDPWAALARLRGETLAVIPAVTQLGEGAAGESRTFQVQLRNNSNKPIRVVGGTTSCPCIATQDLPITIPVGGIESIHVTIKFSGSSGKFAHRFVLYSDTNTWLSVARFSGSVLVPQAAEKGAGEKSFESTSFTKSINRQPDSPVENLMLPANRGVMP